MERDIAALEISIGLVTKIISKKRYFIVKVYGKQLNETINFKDLGPEKLDKMSNNLKRLNSNPNWINPEKTIFRKT